jgi:peptidoglycan hydrolase-like protein with peptidoglycan-binding domain
LALAPVLDHCWVAGHFSASRIRTVTNSIPPYVYRKVEKSFPRVEEVARSRLSKTGAQRERVCIMNSGPTIQIGSTGPDVKRLQRIFVVRKELDYTGIDGAFGAATENAVEQFQSGAGLVADGIVGPLTWAALPPDVDAPELAQGASGAEVSRLQHGLTVVGTYSATVDGDFGPLTAAAVREYQTQRAISVDGIVGDQTWFVPAGAAGATLESLS